MTETYTGRERRKAPRVGYTGSAQVKVETSREMEQTELVTFVNLSESGACLKAGVNINPKTEIVIDFVLPGLLGVHCHAKAKVVWVLSNQVESYKLMGVFFLSFQPGEITVLRSFLQIKLKKESEQV